MASYADHFVFGITADYDTAPDIEALAKGIEKGVARLVTVSRTHRRKRTPQIGPPDVKSAVRKCV